MKMMGLAGRLPRPLLNPQNRWRIGIFHLHPTFRSTTLIPKIPPLRNDTFQAHFAGVLEYRLAIAFQMIREPNPVMSPQDFF